LKGNCIFDFKLTGMFTVINQNTSYSVEKTDEQLAVNGKPILWDLRWISDRRVHLIFQNKSIEAELLDFDKESKTVQIRIGTKMATLQLKDKNDLLLEKLGMNIASSSALKDIKAPMPGLILDLKVKEGDEVKKGDIVLILEAMKMENIIKAPGDGKVKSVKVNLKDSVEKNQVLIQF
jgi:biotin carboxyl carrier protein